MRIPQPMVVVSQPDIVQPMGPVQPMPPAQPMPPMPAPQEEGIVLS